MCDCWERVNDNLQRHGICLDRTETSPPLAIIQLWPRGNARLVAMYCPWCGKKYDEELMGSGVDQGAEIEVSV